MARYPADAPPELCRRPPSRRTTVHCDHCDGELVVFAVPDDLREFAPGDGRAASLCATCLRVADADPGAVPDAAPDFSAVEDAFPSGRGGVALALLIGLLDSLALNRSAVESLAAAAERAGADPFLTLDRVGSARGVDPQFDFERRRRQFESFLS